MLMAELSALLKAQVPLMNALDLLAKQHSATSPISIMLFALKKAVSEGVSFSEALRKYPKIFDVLTVQLIQAGEESAALPEICDHLACHAEKIRLLKMRIKKAMFYPVMVFTIAFILTSGLLLFIVPQFEMLFKNTGRPLPLLTQLILNFSLFFQAHFVHIFIVLIIISSILWTQRKIFSYLYLRLPIIGTLTQKTLLSRFSYTLSLLLSAGIPLTRCLSISAKTLTQSVYQKAVLNVKALVEGGENLSQAFEKTVLFPQLFNQLITIGTQSGSLVLFLNKIADYYNAQADHQLNTLTLLLEPFIMLVLGLLIGTIVIAMYLPIFELGKTF